MGGGKKCRNFKKGKKVGKREKEKKGKGKKTYMISIYLFFLFLLMIYPSMYVSIHLMLGLEEGPKQKWRRG